MAGFRCKCGEGLSNTLAPNDIQLRVYTDKEWDEIIGRGKIEDTLDIPFPKYDVWHCPKCERVYVLDDNGIVIKVYAIEQ